ncbi:MAG: hypothetical protein Fur007_17160 [Rhodoferax sp.]
MPFTPQAMARKTPSQSPRNVTGHSFFGWDGDVLVVNILGKPSASKDAIGKPKGTQLKVSVTAAPVAGRATDHMVRFLAPLFGVTPADIEVVFGRMNVNKQLRIKAPKQLPAVFKTDANEDGAPDSTL